MAKWLSGNYARWPRITRSAVFGWIFWVCSDRLTPGAVRIAMTCSGKSLAAISPALHAWIMMNTRIILRVDGHHRCIHRKIILSYPRAAPGHRHYLNFFAFNPIGCGQTSWEIAGKHADFALARIFLHIASVLWRPVGNHAPCAGAPGLAPGEILLDGNMALPERCERPSRLMVTALRF